MNKDSYAAENDMPYEKFLRLGSSALTEAELLAIIIRTGTKDLKPVEIGHKILSLPSVKSYGLSGLYHVTLKELMGILLDSKEQLLGEELLSIGTVSSSPLSPREVFVAALKKEAVHIMLLHNHPSGDPIPSSEDIRVTEDIKEIGGMMDIPLIDHIIIGDNKYMSFREAGLL